MKVIVALTSHSIRVAHITRTTIWSILQNTYKDLQIVLTLYKDDVKLIPEDLQIMIDNGIVELIIADKDLGPHLKYFYVMQKYRNLPIITIDDDICYPKTMIENMMKEYELNPTCVISRRSFIMQQHNSDITSYKIWLNHFAAYSDPSLKLFPTGVAGILYPPNILKITDEMIPELLTVKYDDDVYLKVLEIRNHILIKNICKDSSISNNSELYDKVNTEHNIQSIALINKNCQDENGTDSNIRKFRTEFNSLF